MTDEGTSQEDQAHHRPGKSLLAPSLFSDSGFMEEERKSVV